MPHVKLLDISYNVVDFVFKEATWDYVVINKQGCTSWPSLRTKEGITSFLLNHYLKKL